MQIDPCEWVHHPYLMIGNAAQVVFSMVWKTLLVRWYSKNLVRFMTQKLLFHLFTAQINSSPKDRILFAKMLCCVSKWLFCYIVQQFDPCIPTPCFTAGKSGHEPVSSNVCLKWSHCSRIVQTKYKLMFASKRVLFWFDDWQCSSNTSHGSIRLTRKTISALAWPHGSCV